MFMCLFPSLHVLCPHWASLLETGGVLDDEPVGRVGPDGQRGHLDYQGPAAEKFDQHRSVC